jgi:hypothetical protein
MTKSIEVIVSPSGETRVETKGFAGSTCQQASKFLEEAIGARQSEKLTAEFYHPAGHSQAIEQLGGQG